MHLKNGERTRAKFHNFLFYLLSSTYNVFTISSSSIVILIRMDESNRNEKTNLTTSFIRLLR